MGFRSAAYSSAGVPNEDGNTDLEQTGWLRRFIGG